MKQALGLVEIKGLSTAVVVADAMAKSANVEIIDIENSNGQGFMAIKIVGDVGAVNAAVSAGKQVAAENGKLVSFKVIPRPSDYIEKAFLQGKKVQKAEPVVVKEEAVEVIKEEPIIEVKNEIIEEVVEEISEEVKVEVEVQAEQVEEAVIVELFEENEPIAEVQEIQPVEPAEKPKPKTSNKKKKH